MSKKFFLLVLISVTTLILSSCVLVKDNSKPLIFNFTKSATLLSQHVIHFSANVVDTGSGLENVLFEINGSPLPTTKEGTSLFSANWLAAYGNYEVTLFAQDRAGNIATQTDKFFVLDSTPPIVEVKSASTVAKGMYFPIKIVAYDPQSGIKNVEVEIDGQRVHVSSDTFEWSFSRDGMHTVSVMAVNGQGLVNKESVEVKVVDGVDIPPYVQVMKYPKVLKSGENATFVVYAYSPFGVKKVDLNVMSKPYKEQKKGNLYLFSVKVKSSTTKIVTATFTVYESNLRWKISKKLLVLSPQSTYGVFFPSNTFLCSSKMVKIPFYFAYVGKTNEKISAYVDGIPVDITGTPPEFFALWMEKPGVHTLTLTLNGKLIGKREFECKVEKKGKR